MEHPYMEQMDYYNEESFAEEEAQPVLQIGENPSKGTIIIVELLFYFSIIQTQFAQFNPLSGIPKAMGALLAIMLPTSFLIYVGSSVKIRKSIWFFAVMMAAANISQYLVRGETPLLGEGLPMLLHSLTFLVMLCFIVTDKKAMVRVVIVLAAVITLSVAFGGYEYGSLAAGGHIGVEAGGRLSLTGAGLGSLFANANQLAYVAGLFSIAALFLSLRSSKIVRLLLWGVGGVMAVFLIRTVSRGGAAVFVCGLAVLFAGIIFGKGARVSGIMMIIAGVIAMLVLGGMLAEKFYIMKQRQRTVRESSRLDVYSMETVGDLKKTMVLGWGPSRAITSALIEPHNTFFYTHLAFGGMYAWIYALWLIYLARKILKIIFSDYFEMDIKMFVLALFGMSLGAQLLSNQGHIFISCLFATAVIERYDYARILKTNRID